MPIQIEMFSETTVERIECDPEDRQKTNAPIVRVALDGGCNLIGCNCSPDPFITVSDGKTVMVVTLSKVDAEALAETGRLMLGPR